MMTKSSNGLLAICENEMKWIISSYHDILLMQIQTVGARGVHVRHRVPGGHLYLLYRSGENFQT